MSLSDEIVKYGEVLFEYEGKGIIYTEENDEYKCEFYACQFKNGKVMIGFSIPDSLVLNKQIKEFSGNTFDKSWSLKTTGPFSEMFFKPDITKDFYGSWILFHTSRLIVMKDDKSENTKYSFGITNFEFAKINKKGQNLDIKKDLDIKIKVINNYREKINNIKAKKGIDITGEIEILSSISYKFEKIIEIVDNICFLLSLARGTKIQYIYYKEKNVSDDHLVKIKHFSRVTNQYVPFKVIDFFENMPISEFINQTYNQYANNKKDYNLNKGIEALIYARSTHDFLELRGVKLAVVLEILINSFINNSENIGYIFPPKKYEKQIEKELYYCLNDKLKELEIGHDKIQELIGNENNINLKSLNRKSFGNLIKKMFEQIGLKYNYKEIKLFKSSRNKLVHQGCFCSQIDSEKSIFSSPYAEYLFMINMLDKIFLKLIGFKGKYIDRSNPNNPQSLVL